MENLTGVMVPRLIRRVLRRNALLLGLIFAIATAPLKAATSPEYELKAAFLLNFTKFVEWPPTAFPQADSPISICVIGTDPFGTTLDQLVAGEVVAGRRVAVNRYPRLPSPQSCQVAFFSKSVQDTEDFAAGAAAGVLTVGERSGFLKDGGMIELTIEDRRVRFLISQKRAESNGLKISSRLLSVAKAVEK